MPYTGLGFAAGIITGIGLTGCLWLLIALLRSRSADKHQNQILQVVDVEQGSEAIVNDSNGEQDSNNNNTTITVS